MFFDGTKNNAANDTPKSRESNVARLYASHGKDDESFAKYRVYVNGLGSPFKEIGENDYSNIGLAFGFGGERRLQWARKQFDERIQKAKARAQNPKQPIRMINVAIFGFSRGAALARAFAVRIAKECKQEDDGWKYQHLPIRLYFMGLFDTVASAGLPASFKSLDRSPKVKFLATAISPAISSVLSLFPSDGHYDWAKDLKIPPMAEQCVHYVAAHEVRNSFPLDSVRDGERYPPNCVEVIYPGVHSDVGGAYAPSEQARSLNDAEKLSQIPLLHMHRAAYAAGVPLLTLDSLDVDARARFNLSPKTAALFDAYQKLTTASGPLETAVATHLYQLYLARSYLSKVTGDAAAHARLPAALQILKQLGNEDPKNPTVTQLAKITAGGNEVSQASTDAQTKKRNEQPLSLREATLARAYEHASQITGSATTRQNLARLFRLPGSRLRSRIRHRSFEIAELEIDVLRGPGL